MKAYHAGIFTHTHIYTHMPCSMLLRTRRCSSRHLPAWFQSAWSCSAHYLGASPVLFYPSLVCVEMTHDVRIALFAAFRGFQSSIRMISHVSTICEYMWIYVYIYIICIYLTRYMLLDSATRYRQAILHALHHKELQHVTFRMKHQCALSTSLHHIMRTTAIPIAPRLEALAFLCKWRWPRESSILPNRTSGECIWLFSGSNQITYFLYFEAAWRRHFATSWVIRWNLEHLCWLWWYSWTTWPSRAYQNLPIWKEKLR